MYLDYAELQAHNKRIMYMKDWVAKLDAFLQFNEKEILQNTGKVTHAVALALAEQEFEKFIVQRDKDYISDFDRATQLLSESSKKQ